MTDYEDWDWQDLKDYILSQDKKVQILEKLIFRLADTIAEFGEEGPDIAFEVLDAWLSAACDYGELDWMDEPGWYIKYPEARQQETE